MKVPVLTDLNNHMYLFSGKCICIWQYDLRQYHHGPRIRGNGILLLISTEAVFKKMANAEERTFVLRLTDVPDDTVFEIAKDLCVLIRRALR